MVQPINYNFDRSKETAKKEYFSGANVRVYFGDVWIDQMASISFELQEQVTPVYGFHSHTFDRVSRGSRIVQGSFSLNFTENGYLQTILDSLASREGSQGRVKNQPSLPINHTNSEQTIQNILQSNGLGAYKEYISSLKESFWGNDTPEYLGASSVNKERDVHFYPSQWDEEARMFSENPLKENGFNILIDYSPDANYTDFEQCLKNIKTNGSLLQTYRTIVGVHITGVSEQIGNNGQVLQQHYQFIARDLDGDITEDSLSSTFLKDFKSLEKNRDYNNLTGGNLGSGAGGIGSNTGTGGLTSPGGGCGAGGGGGGGVRGPITGGGGGGGSR